MKSETNWTSPICQQARAAVLGGMDVVTMVACRRYWWNVEEDVRNGGDGAIL